MLEVEETASGRGSVRSGLERVLGAAQRGAIDVVLVQRLDRFGRSTLGLLANLRRLRSAGVGFVAIAQGLEVRPQHDAVSDLTFTVLAAVAEFERAVIVERTLDGLAAARRAGKKLGRPLVGGAGPGSRGPPRLSRVGSEVRASSQGTPGLRAQGEERRQAGEEPPPLEEHAHAPCAASRSQDVLSELALTA